MNIRNQVLVLVCGALLVGCGGSGTDLIEPEGLSDPLLPLLSTGPSEDVFEQYWSCDDNAGGEGILLSFWEEKIQAGTGGVTHNGAAVARSKFAIPEAWEWQSGADGAVEIVSTNLVLPQPDSAFRLTTLQFDEQNNGFTAFDNRNSSTLTCERQLTSAQAYCEFWGNHKEICAVQS